MAGGERADLLAGDWAVIGVYFAAIAAIAAWAWRRQRADERRASAAGAGGGESYFLGGRDAGAAALAAALFCSNVGAEHMVGMAGAGAREGLAAGFFEWGAMPCLLLLGWYFLPLYLRIGVCTMPAYLGERYGPRARALYGVLCLLVYVFTKVSVALYACAILFDVLLGASIVASSAALIAATALYTVLGGMRAVIYTEALQAVVLVGGGALLAALALRDVGGYAALRRRLEGDVDPAKGWFSLWRPADDELYPWTGFVFGFPVQSVWYWCCDQVIVQRGLAARSLGDARAGCAGCAALKILPPFLFVIPGMCARVLYSEVADDADDAYPLLIARVMPHGAKGVIAAAMLSALMSSLAAVFNSCAAIGTLDFYQPLYPDASPEVLVRVGRASTAAAACIGAAWAPVIPYMGDDLWDYLQAVSSYLSPPILAPFLAGMWWRGASEAGAVASMVVGLVLAAARIALTLLPAGTREALPQPLRGYACLPFLNLAPLLLLCCAAALAAASLRWPAAPPRAAHPPTTAPPLPPLPDPPLPAAAAAARAAAPAAVAEHGAGAAVEMAAPPRAAAAAESARLLAPPGVGAAAAGPHHQDLPPAARAGAPAAVLAAFAALCLIYR